MLLLDIRKVKQTDGFYLLEVEKIISETGQSDKPREDDLLSFSISLGQNQIT